MTVSYTHLDVYKRQAYEDMVVAGEYSDEGFSGKNIQGRQEFQRMLNDIQDCKDGVSYVLVFKLSRFGRNAWLHVFLRCLWHLLGERR